MPTYVYECKKCDEEIEVWQSFADDSLKRHAGCGGKLTKVFQPVGIVLKGPGFYKTDNRNGKSAGSKSDSGSGGESAKKSESGSGSSSKSESNSDSNGGSKSDTKSDSKSGSAKASKTA